MSKRLLITLNMYFNQVYIEQKIKQSIWWQKAAVTVDSHFSNDNNVMLTHHLEAVYDNIHQLFHQPLTPFLQALFALLPPLELEPTTVEQELKIVALLHDIGKIEEDKSLVVPHPLTGKPAHKRHGLVSLMAAMQIIEGDLDHIPAIKNRIFRVIELHDMSYGLYREYESMGEVPETDRWQYISNKIFPQQGVGLMYLLLFKLADIHGHGNVSDVIWFYENARDHYFNKLNIALPIPSEQDIR